MNMSKLVIAVAAMVILSACATTTKYQQKLQAWQGRDISDFIHAWGYPDETMTAPNGNQVYIYRQNTVQSIPIYNSPSYTTISTQSNQTVITQVPSVQTGGGTFYFNCTTWIDFDKQNHIVNTSFRGNDCVAK